MSVKGRAPNFLNSGEVLRSLSESISDAILFIAIDGPLTNWSIVDCNEAAWRIHGYNRKEDILNHPFSLLCQDAEEFRDIIANIKGQDVITKNTLHHKQDGSVFTMRGNYRFVLLRGQEYLIAVEREITEDKQLQALQIKLSEAEDRFQAIFDSSPDGIVIINPTKKAKGPWLIEYCNRAFCEMNGFDRSELIGKDIRVVSNETATEVELRNKLHEKLEEGSGDGDSHRHEYYKRLQMGPITVEEIHKRKDGSTFPIQASSSLVKLGGQERVLGIDRDISERIQVQEALAHQAEELNLRNTELARLYHATGSLISNIPFDLEDLARTMVSVIQEEFGQANCSVVLVQGGSNELRQLAIAGPYASQVSKIVMTRDGPGLIPKAIRTGRVINTPDVLKSPDYVPAWEAARSELTIPLVVGDQVIGVIDIQGTDPDTFSANDERLMTIFAERASLMLEHARLFAQAERRTQNLLSLRKIDSAIAGSSDLSFTIGILLDQVTKQLGVHAADVLAFNPVTQTFRFSAGQGFHTQASKVTDLHLGDGYAGRAVRERHSIVVQRLNENLADLQRSNDFAREGFVTYVATPLIAKGQVQGVLEIFHRDELHLDQERFSFLEMLAGQAAIAVDNARLFEHLQSSNSELTMAYDETIEGWSRAMDLRDEETEGHSLRVTELTLRLANSLGVGIEETVHIRRGALLHDIGKIGVPDRVLHKPGPLTDEEWVIMRKHPQFAHDMLAPILYMNKALDIPYCHHEKWDGTGYPRGLRGEQIPLAARIFAVADVWDALISDRPYRKAWPEAKALQYIRAQAGKHFDPGVVEAFLQQAPLKTE